MSNICFPPGYKPPDKLQVTRRPSVDAAPPSAVSFREAAKSGSIDTLAECLGCGDSPNLQGEAQVQTRGTFGFSAWPLLNLELAGGVLVCRQIDKSGAEPTTDALPPLSLLQAHEVRVEKQSYIHVSGASSQPLVVLYLTDKTALRSWVCALESSRVYARHSAALAMTPQHELVAWWQKKLTGLATLLGELPALPVNTTAVAAAAETVAAPRRLSMPSVPPAAVTITNSNRPAAVSTSHTAPVAPVPQLWQPSTPMREKQASPVDRAAPDAVRLAYLEQRSDILEELEQLLSGKFTGCSNTAVSTAETVLNATCAVAFVGSHDSGKSSLINALLGAPLLPVRPGPCTAACIKLDHLDGAAADTPLRLLVTEPGAEPRELRQAEFEQLSEHPKQLSEYLAGSNEQHAVLAMRELTLQGCVLRPVPVVWVDTAAEAEINELDDRYDVLVQCVPATSVMLNEPLAQAAVIVRTMSDRLSSEELQCCQLLSESSPWSKYEWCGGWVSVGSHQTLQQLAQHIQVAAMEWALKQGERVMVELKRERLMMQFAVLESSIRELSSSVSNFVSDAKCLIPGDVQLQQLLDRASQQVGLLAELRIGGPSQPGKWVTTNGLLRRPVLHGETAVDVHFVHIEGQHDPQLLELARFRVSAGGWKVPISEEEFDKIVYGAEWDGAAPHAVWLQGDLFASHVFVPELRSRIVLVHEASKELKFGEQQLTAPSTEPLPPPASFWSLFTGSGELEQQPDSPASDDRHPNDKWMPAAIKVCVWDEGSAPTPAQLDDDTCIVVQVVWEGDITPEQMRGGETSHMIDGAGMNGEALGQKLQLHVWKLFENRIRPEVEKMINEHAVEEKLVWWRDICHSTDKTQILLKLLYTYALNGNEAGSFEGAMTVAPRYMSGNSTATACTSLVRWHSGVTFGTGFLTGFGGFVTMPFTVPTAMLATWMTSARLAFCIAYVCKYDPWHPRVCNTVLHCIVGGKEISELQSLVQSLNATPASPEESSVPTAPPAFGELVPLVEFSYESAAPSEDDQTKEEQVDSTDLYGLLGVARDASETDIRRAYRKKALKWHPDKNPDRTQEAEKHFKMLASAYETLSDPELRANYDDTGDWEWAVNALTTFNASFARASKILLETTRKARKNTGVGQIGVTKAAAQALKGLAVHTVEKTLEAGAQNVARQTAVHMAESVYKQQFARVMEQRLAAGLSETVAVQAAESAAKSSAQKSFAAVMERESAKAAGKQLSERASSSALSHAIPVIGAIVAGAVDCATTNSVGRFACKVFLPDSEADEFNSMNTEGAPTAPAEAEETLND